MLHSRLKGRDLHSPTNEVVENNTGSIILAMKAVRLTSQGTAYPQVELANPSLHPNFGVTYDTIANGKTGMVCAFGFMVDVDTSLWTVGSYLYSDANGNLSTTINGGIVAQVMKQDATVGILYVVTEAVSMIEKNFWALDGNAGIDDNLQFLGTVDAKDLNIRTNNVRVAKIDKQGRFGLGPDVDIPIAHFHQKSHMGYPGTGLRQETFALYTDSLTSQIAYSITLPNPCVVRVEYIVVGRSDDGTKRCTFKRTGLFYRQLSNVQSQGTWLSDQTIKNDNNLDVGYSLTATDLNLTVKAGTTDVIYWTGHVNIELLVGST
jgi:hypothetical protein